jgi:hypothetical protein
VEGNYVDEAPDVTKNNWFGIDMGKDATADDKKAAVQDKPFPTEEISQQTAVAAYEEVLKNVGASYHRDTLDERVIGNVRDRTGGYIDVQGGYPHGTAYEQTVNAWPALKTLPALKDTDMDGMPDDWEKKNGLNSNDATDASGYSISKGYTNVEVYLNELVSVKSK